MVGLASPKFRPRRKFRKVGITTVRIFLDGAGIGRHDCTCASSPKTPKFVGLQEARSFLPVPHLPKPLQQHEVYVTVSSEFQLVQNRKTFAPRTKSLTAKSPPKIPLYSTMKFIYQVTNPHSSVKSLGFRSATNSNHALRYCQQQ